MENLNKNIWQLMVQTTDEQYMTNFECFASPTNYYE